MLKASFFGPQREEDISQNYKSRLLGQGHGEGQLEVRAHVSRELKRHEQVLVFPLA